MVRLLSLSTLALFALAAVSCGSDDQEDSADQGRQQIPALAAADQEAYRQSIIGQGIVQQTCDYEGDRGLVDCLDHGLYRLEPRPVGEDLSCVIGVAGGTAPAGGTPPPGGKPQFLICSTTTGENPKYYAIEA
jgi:hypothetical protein